MDLLPKRIGRRSTPRHQVAIPIPPHTNNHNQRIPTITTNKELIMPKTTLEQNNAVVRSYPERVSGLPSHAQSAWVWMNGDRSSPDVGRRHTIKRNSMRFAAALLAALATFVADPNAALAAAPQHHDQVPGFYRLQVGDFEVTALYDGTGAFAPHWLNATKATLNGVSHGLHEKPPR